MQSLPKRILEISKSIRPISESGFKQTKVIARADARFAIIDEGVEAFENFIATVSGIKNYSEKFSEKFLTSECETMLVSLIKKEFEVSEVERTLSEFLKKLDDFNQKYRVLIPLTGIQLQIGKLIAGNVTFVHGNDVFINEILSDVENIILSTRHTDAEKQEFIRSESSQLKSNLAGKVVSEFIVCADQTRARERALDETRRAIDILKFSIPAIYSKGYNVNIGIHGDVIRDTLITTIISVDKKSFSDEYSIVGRLMDYELNDDTINLLKQNKIDTMFEVLKKKYATSTEIEKILLRSIHWYAEHISQSELESKLLNLIVALETLLTPRDGAPIAATIAENVALIFADNVENRKKIKKRVKELYRLRSAISHGGLKSIQEKDVDDLEYLCRCVITLIFEKAVKFNKQQDLLDWLDELKFS